MGANPKPIVWQTFGEKLHENGRGVPTPERGVPTYYLAIFFAENCMKMKEFGSRGWPMTSASS